MKVLGEIIFFVGMGLSVKHHLIDFNDGLINFNDYYVMLAGAGVMAVGI